MAQPSIKNYFQARKRNAVDESNIIRAKKVLVLDSEEDRIDVTRSKNINFWDDDKVKTKHILYSDSKERSSRKELIMAKDKISHSSEKDMKFPTRNRVVAKLDFDTVRTTETAVSAKKTASVKSKHKKLNNQGDIKKIFENAQNKNSNNNGERKIFSHKENIQKINEQTPPASPVKSAMDNVAKSDLTLSEIKAKLTRSARLAELKASISKFNQHAEKLRVAEKKTKELGPSLNKFNSIELEVELSPKKAISPAKSYLSPMKDVSPRKNLFGMKSPIKSPLSSPVNVPAYQRFQHLASPGKPSLTLPYHYRNLAELFRSIDTVCSMLFNRKENITFTKLKPAVQEMIRKNLDVNHFGQIKTLYPDAFIFSCEKIRAFGSKEGKYELVIKPNIPLSEGAGNEPVMNPNILLQRRRTLFNSLIEKVKHYHNEFLMLLDPPMIIPPEKLTRWHPEFDIEKIPDITKSELPQPPAEEKLTTGQEVLEKARTLFNCNTRMEKALEMLKKVQEEREASKATCTETSTSIVTTVKPISSALKGIPQSLLEKVRAKQAAKALETMTRDQDQDKEAMMYARLPDIARLMRNTYVAERKGVLALEEVIKKLNNSYRSHLTNSEIEKHLRLIAKNVPGWLVFHELRGTLFIKLSRDGDMKKVMTKLEQLAKEKSGT